MLGQPGRRSGRCWLWVRYALRRHQMTGHRVRHLRWRIEVSPSGRRIYRLGAWDASATTWVGWDWPG